ncbi:MAG TPA: WD40 repeat domain-containing protein [Sandaracinaceae bacterium LLY-WYZ-13_1]|nr:WD40 repeat domain-containing protein [Sandaracinaceae bacterium LLY-WYZ-13_1]
MSDDEIPWKDATPAVSHTLSESPTCLAWSSDGARLVVADAGGEVRCFDRSGRGLWDAQLHLDAVLDLALGSRGTLVTGGADGRCIFSELGGGSVRAEVRSGDARIERVACADELGLAVAAAGRALRAYTTDGRERWTEPEVPSPIADVGLGSGGEVRTACEDGVHLLRPEGAPRRLLAWEGPMICLAFDPRAESLAGGCHDGSVHVWRLGTVEGSRSTSLGHVIEPRFLAWSPDGQHLAAIGASSIAVWSSRGEGDESGRPWHLPHVEHPVSRVSFGARRLAAAGDGVVSIWDPRADSGPARRAELGGRVEALAWCPRGDALAAATTPHHLYVFGADRA